MLASATKILLTIVFIIALRPDTCSQDLTRAIELNADATVEITNLYGKIGVRAVSPTDGEPFKASLTASSSKPVLDKEIKMNASSGHLTVEVVPADPQSRIDLVLIVPERVKLKVETRAGAVELAGNFTSIEAKTGTGTIAVDVPADDLKYQLKWIESRPRFLADFELAKVKEKSAGRFEIKGHFGEGKSEKEKGKIDDAVTDPPDPDDPKDEKDKGKKDKSEVSRSVQIDLTTARGIILLNVPPNEVMSDLKVRPLTEAAKAIIRSGDSLLMEAIRRASPKYFGDYARTLPPYKREPSLKDKSDSGRSAGSKLKTAVVRVTDVKNRAIGGLEAKDFEVAENGIERQIISVERSTAPFDLVLLLDVSGSVQNYVNFIRKAARSFVDTVDKNDRVSIVIFNDDVKMLSKFTTDKALLSKSLDTFDAGGGTAYYDAIAYTVADVLRPLKGGRTAVVILTDGDDNRSFLPFDSLLGSIQESGALIYPLYVPSGLIEAAAANPEGEIDPTRMKYMSLTAKSEGEGDRLAQISGGVYYPITQISQIQKAYEDIVLQMRSAYNITFVSDTATTAPDGVSPRLKIKAKRENVFTSVTSVAAAGADN